MQTTANEKKVIDFLKKTPNTNKADISAATEITGLPLFNFLRKLEKAELITSQGTGADAAFTWNEEKTEAQGDGVVEEVVEAGKANGKKAKNVAPPAEGTAEVTTAGKNTDKYKFNGEEYGKGQLVRAVVAKYIEDNPDTTSKDLLNAFPQTLMPRFGVFADHDTAVKLSGTRSRYFMKPEQLLKIKGQKAPIAVCNQWTAALIVEFIAVAKGLGYKIK